jgi:hypothetical protein
VNTRGSVGVFNTVCAIERAPSGVRVCARSIVPYEADKLPARHFLQPLRNLSRSKIIFVTFPESGTDGRFGMVAGPGREEKAFYSRISDFVFKLGDGTGACGVFTVNARLALLALDLNHGHLF